MVRGTKALWLILLLFGCATVVTGGGQDQTIVIETEPSGALCVAARDGAIIGSVTTPGTIVVSRSRKPIIFHCMKEGCIETDMACSAAGNMIRTGSAMFDLIQLGVDASTGAAWAYPTRLALKLIPDTGIIVGSVPPPHYPHLLPGKTAQTEQSAPGVEGAPAAAESQHRPAAPSATPTLNP